MFKIEHKNIDIEKIRQGNTREFESLYRQFCQFLVLHANKYVYDLDIAENIVQDVFMNIWKNREKLDPSRNIKTYLYISVKNHALNIVHHKDIKRRYQEKIIIDQIETNTPESNYALKELENEINKAIQSLPEKCRMIFVLSRHDHLTYAEIATVLGISIKTIENQMIKALKIMNTYLAPFISKKI